MRRTLAIVSMVLGVGACQCGAPSPTAVTLVVKNTSTDPIFVDDTSGQIGVALEDQQSGAWTAFTETPACACLACSQICGGCSCDAGTGDPMVLMIAPGDSVQRSWAGVIQQTGLAGCGQLVGGSSCLNAFNPQGDQTLQAQLCYGLAGEGLPPTDGGTPVPGLINPNEIVCVSRQFHTTDGTVELTPERGQACTQNSDCANAPGSDGGELCFSQSCTSACPANSFPTIGANWLVYVPTPSPAVFFSASVVGDDTIYSGTGVVKAVSYGSNIMQLSLAHDAGLSSGADSLSVELPPSYEPPMFVGDGVSVTVIDDSQDHPGNAAVSIRSSDGGLLLAADSAQFGPLLSFADTAPFLVTQSGNIVGCDYNNCGKRLDYTTLFDGGTSPIELAPGEAAIEIGNGVGFQLLNVGDNGYTSTGCSVSSQMPYVIFNPRSG